MKAGGPTVKNVSGYDLCRLLVGSLGTLGLIGEVILRTRPVPAVSRWFRGRHRRSRRACCAAVHRPACVLWDGTTTWVLLEGHPDDVDAQAVAAGLAETDGPPVAAAAPVVDRSPTTLRRGSPARSSPRSASASSTTPTRSLDAVVDPVVADLHRAHP